MWYTMSIRFWSIFRHKHFGNNSLWRIDENADKVPKASQEQNAKQWMVHIHDETTTVEWVFNKIRFFFIVSQIMPRMKINKFLEINVFHLYTVSFSHLLHFAYTAEWMKTMNLKNIMGKYWTKWYTRVQQLAGWSAAVLQKCNTLKIPLTQ